MNEGWTGRAGFVSRPRTIDDLRDEKNTRLEEIDYEVTTIVNLDSVDYENFITDMTVSRDYLEDVSGNKKEKIKCLLVMRRGFSEGVLVVPNDEGFVDYAAIYRT